MSLFLIERSVNQIHIIVNYAMCNLRENISVDQRAIIFMSFSSTITVCVLYRPGSVWMSIGFSGITSVTRSVAEAMVSADAALDSRPGQ